MDFDDPGFRELIDALHDGVYITDADGITLKVNSAYERLTGLRAEDVVGQHMQALVEQGVISQSVSLRVLKEGKALSLMQSVSQGKRLLVSGTPIFAADGRVRYVVSTVRDMTELLRMKHERDELQQLKQLRNSTAKLHAGQRDDLLDASPVADKPASGRVFMQARQVAASDVKVLLQGETGVGKTLIAQYIHKSSPRAAQPFLALNCGALPENLIEAELFGYVPGAFTGAGSKGKRGLLELPRLNITNPLIVTDAILIKSGTVEHVLKQLGERRYGIYDGVEPEPEIAIVEACAKVYRDGGHDGLIGVGGGSAIDIAKAVAGYVGHDGALEELFGVDQIKRKGPPLIAIPTTAGTGSEVTNVSILSDKQAQLKKGIVSDYLLPDVALVSPLMTLTCPRGVTAASGVDALVHAVESYLSVNASPITDALAIGAIKLIAKALPKAYANPADLLAREDMATASLMAGMAFGNAGVGAVHALAYPLGGRFNIAHGVSNALLLPYVMAWNKLACVERMAEIAAALGVQTHGLSDKAAADLAVEAMAELCASVDIPKGMRSFGVPEDAIPAMAEEASKIDRLMRNNPRRLTAGDIEQIYRAAY